MTDMDFEALMKRGHQLINGLRAATRIAELPVNPEYGISSMAKLDAINDVLRVAQERFDGKHAHVTEKTMKLMNVVLADVEVRLLWDRMGLTHWRPGV